jgi:hypothetical protein
MTVLKTPTYYSEHPTLKDAQRQSGYYRKQGYKTKISGRKGKYTLLVYQK